MKMMKVDEDFIKMKNKIKKGKINQVMVVHWKIK